MLQGELQELEEIKGLVYQGPAAGRAELLGGRRRRLRGRPRRGRRRGALRLPREVRDRARRGHRDTTRPPRRRRPSARRGRGKRRRKPKGQIDLRPDMTTDSLQLFLKDIGKVRLLTAQEEVELAKRIERGDLDAKQKMVESNLRLVVSIAKNYRNQGLPVPRPDPGGDARARARRREVRLPQGLQVLHLRDLVDPPGDRPRARRQGAHDPDPGARRREAEQDRPRRAQAGDRARSRAHRRRRSPP